MALGVTERGFELVDAAAVQAQQHRVVAVIELRKKVAANDAHGVSTHGRFAMVPMGCVGDSATWQRPASGLGVDGSEFNVLACRGGPRRRRQTTEGPISDRQVLADGKSLCLRLLDGL